MNPTLYKAASLGDVDVLRQHKDQIALQATPNRNTALHVAAQFGHLQCVREILEQCPSLLRKVNIKRETPLHVATREGYFDIAQALVEHAKISDCAKEIMRATNADGDTALHMAVRNGNLQVVRLLTQEDPSYPHARNHAQETPLYLAAERGYVEMVSAILEICTSPAYGGPNDTTALHAAIIHDPELAGNTKRLLEWKKGLIEEKDRYGWTPLHYAARYRNVAAIKMLLETDQSVAYITANWDDTTALHIAATYGYVNVMEELLSHCPDCWETIKSNKQNVLHIAVDMEREEVIKAILEKPWSSHLINQKDNQGNTPLHLLASAELEMSVLWSHRRADQHAFNDQNMTPVDVKLSKDEVDFFSEPQRGGERNVPSNDWTNKYNWRNNRRELKRVSKEKMQAQLKAANEEKKKSVEDDKKLAGTHRKVSPYPPIS